jgi:hypothetical protein
VIFGDETHCRVHEKGILEGWMLHPGMPAKDRRRDNAC